jgi:hypothetical protein
MGVSKSIRAAAYPRTASEIEREGFVVTTTRLGQLAGVAAVLLFVVAVIVSGEPPDGDDSLREITQFYRENDTDQMWGAGLVAWGAALFLVFLSALWKVLREAEGAFRGPSTLALAGGIVFTVGLTVFAGISFALGDLGEDLAPVALQALHALNVDFFFPVAVGLAGFLLGSGLAIVRTGALPKWLGWVAVVLAPIAITPVGFVVFLLNGLWILVVSVLLFMRAETAGPAGPAGPPEARGV